jgi:hypothetical protein
MIVARWNLALCLLPAAAAAVPLLLYCLDSLNPHTQPRTPNLALEMCLPRAMVASYHPLGRRDSVHLIEAAFRLQRIAPSLAAPAAAAAAGGRGPTPAAWPAVAVAPALFVQMVQPQWNSRTAAEASFRTVHPLMLPEGLTGADKKTGTWDLKVAASVVLPP